jgi:hypothetical protein
LSETLRRFAQSFVRLKNEREQADYHPLSRFSISHIRNQCMVTETVLEGFWNAPRWERTSFACRIAFRFDRRVKAKHDRLSLTLQSRPHRL